MKNKVRLSIVFFIIVLFFSYNSFATENDISEVPRVQEPPELISEEVLTTDNYYKYNEELHKNNSIEKQVYNSDSTAISLEDYIIQQSLSCPEYIDISQYNIPFENAEEVLIPFLYCDEMFYIDAISNWKGKYLDYDYETQTGTAVLTEVYFEYTLTPDEIKEAWNVINREVRSYKNGIKPEWNELEKVLYTNDFLCHKCEYATNIISSSHTLYGALVDRKPVCDGYSHAFRYLLKQIGMEASMVTSNPMNHAWNLVKIDGQYYHIDVTWDDTYTNGVKGIGKTSYEFFLASDSSFQNERSSSHNNWVADYNASSTKYDGNQEWRNQNNYLIYKDNYWYFLEANSSTYTANLYKINLRANSPKKELVKTNNTGDYIFMASGLTTDGTNLYYSTEYKTFKMDYNGENLELFFELQMVDSKCIYSLEIIDDIFYYDTLDFEKFEDGRLGVKTSTRKTNIYDAYEPEETLIYTTIDFKDIDGKQVMTFSSDKTISGLLVPENFPVIDKNYIVEVYSPENNVKADNEKIGSKNIIRITKAGKVIAEYIAIVKGDINGDGQVKMYDAFTILKSALFERESLTIIDILIRDYNDDSQVKMYDAFSFLKYSLFNK